jgi:hypothetical protein
MIARWIAGAVLALIVVVAFGYYLAWLINQAAT